MRTGSINAVVAHKLTTPPMYMYMKAMRLIWQLVYFGSIIFQHLLNSCKLMFMAAADSGVLCSMPGNC